VASTSQGKGWGGSSLREEVRAVASFLHRDPLVIIDVGANIGDYTQAWLDHTASLPVCHLFEPSQVNLQHLRHRFSDLSAIHIYPFALSDQPSISRLYANVPGSALSSLSKRDLDHLSIDMPHQEDVVVERLDSLVQNGLLGSFEHRVIDLLKLDVEGHELAVLRGCGDFLNDVMIVQFEFGTASLDTNSRFLDFCSFFTSKGFRLWRITPRGVVPVSPYKESLESFRLCNYLAVSPLLLEQNRLRRQA